MHTINDQSDINITEWSVTSGFRRSWRWPIWLIYGVISNFFPSKDNDDGGGIGETLNCNRPSNSKEI